MIDFKLLIETYPDCLSNRTIFRSYLLDMFPNEKKSINILTSIYECGISQKMQKMKCLTEHDVLIFVNQLERDYGIAPKYATEYIYMWAEVYGLKDFKLNDNVNAIHTNNLTSLAAFFEANGFEVVDKRKSGGCLWVVGEQSKLEPYVEKVRELFSVSGGGYAKGRATRGRPGWFTSSKK